MVILKNSNYNNFIAELNGKRIICFGAGGTLSDFLFENQGKIELLERIDFVLDNNLTKKDNVIYFNLKQLPVITLADLIQSDISFSEYAIILTVANKYISDVISQLDNVPQLDDVYCYCGLNAISWGREVYPPLGSTLPKAKKGYSISKVIHYCWFGGKSMSTMEQECVESWKRKCPDYEIKLWNESNYDIYAKPPYVIQAYEAKKYAFVSDYARLDIIYNYGGVYLDTDVELLKNIDALLKYKAFFGFESLNLVATGLGFGSVSKNPTVKDLMDLYSRVQFSYNDGTINITPCTYYHTEYFGSKGLSINNSMQLIDDMLFLSNDFLCPLNQRSILYEFTGNTISDHKFCISWLDEKLRGNLQDKIKQFEEINFRLKNDWARSI